MGRLLWLHPRAHCEAGGRHPSLHSSEAHGTSLLADGMWRLLYGHAGNHYSPDRLGVFATIKKFLFRQRVLLMCSVNVDAAKELNDLVKESSMKVGINMEQMEDAIKEPTTVDIGTGGGVPNTTCAGSSGTIGGSRRTSVEYEKAPWVEANVKTMVPEPSANMNDMWFYVNHGVDRSILCDRHYNGNDDEVMPHDIMKVSYGYGKTCIVCSANEMSDKYYLWPPEWQRQSIVKMAARIKTFTVKMSEEGSKIADPQENFVQFLKDITYAMVGNKRSPYGEILLKPISHLGMVRVPRDRVTQIFMGKRGRQYTVIREEFLLEGDNGRHERFAYRVAKDYGNVFYKDYKLVLGREFDEIMDYADVAAEKCGDVVECSSACWTSPT